jgi:hypothetical protein
MRSNKALSRSMERREIESTLEAIRISSELIAFYPQPLRQPQPYVILLDAASGILKRLDLRATK